MGFVKTGISAIGKLAILALLLASFLGAMAGVVYMSLSGNEITVPEITGKDFFESEKELAALGLKIKRRADRPSTEKMNTVLEQLPKSGETVKTGQMIFVVVSKAGAEGEETPKSLIKDLETDDTDKIKDMIDDKPKKPKATNSNTRKKADTTRDVNGKDSNSNSNSDDKSNSKSGDPDKKDPVKDPADKGNKDKGNKNTSTSGAKPQATPGKPLTRDQRIRTQPKPQ
ncbi:MAG: PASTA domain-containing protein [Acidobacteria bacterium]|nr:PASTA domain-containing protein [Acidobacteriota bacterium]